MLSVPSAMRIFVHTQATDMRKQFNGLHAIVTHSMGQDVMTGDYFVFFNRRKHRCKILYWDHDGLVVWAKKFESDYPHFLLFTENGEYAHNLDRQPDSAGRVDSGSTSIGSRRRPMPQEIAVIAPPRAQYFKDP